jgi:uncharacterized protein (TIGR00299 family) protein
MAQDSHIHLDAVGGAAGDMFAAALLDARPDLQPRVFTDLASVIPAACGTPRLTEGLSGGIAACRFGLVGDGSRTARHGSHEHDGDAPRTHERGVRFAELAQRVASASLHAGTADQAIGILRRLAESESRLHRVPVEDVHFHELADWDSLMDVVAAGSIAAALAPCTWSVSDLPRGHGQVRTQHGLLPIPAPATADLLRNFRWRDDGIGGERVTPTGAAILAHLVNAASPPGENLLLQAVGIGAGTREFAEMPNILRALVFAIEQPRAAMHGYRDDVVVLSFDIDDMTGEEVGVAADRLRSADGVLDLSIGSRQGKKGRPLTDFRLLLRPQSLDAVSRLCFLETSTIGLRWRREQRACLTRSTESVEAEGEQLRRKRSLRPGGGISLKVESDDVARFGGLVERRRMKVRGEQGSEDS